MKTNTRPVGQEAAGLSRSRITRNRCGGTGFVWHQLPGGRWSLYGARADGTPTRPHACSMPGAGGAVARQYASGYAKSEPSVAFRRENAEPQTCSLDGCDREANAFTGDRCFDHRR